MAAMAHYPPLLLLPWLMTLAVLAQHSYNNTGWSLLGRVLEVVADKPYERIIQEEIFEPLGLTNSFFFPEDCLTHSVSVGHGDGKVKEGWLLPRCSFPAGAICCSVLDLLQYGRYITHPKACMCKPRGVWSEGLEQQTQSSLT